MSDFNIKRSFELAFQSSGMTRKELATELGFTQALITNVCNGSSSISIGKAAQCATAMGFKFSEFIALSDAKCEVRTVITFKREIK